MLENRIARTDARLAAIQDHMVTKADVASLKLWILGGVLSAAVAGAVIAVATVKALS